MDARRTVEILRTLRLRPTVSPAFPIAVIAALLHVTALSGGFVWDDFTFAEDWGTATLRQMIAPKIHEQGNPLWRPVGVFFARLDYSMWGLEPAGWHATNLLLHGLAAAMVFLVVRRILDSPRLGALAGFAFAFHPAGSEVAAWVTSRFDSVALIFGLASSLAVLTAVDGRQSKVDSPNERTVAWAWVAGGLAFLSLLSKETGVIWIVLAPACAVVVRMREGKPLSRAQWASRGLPFVIALLAYIVFRTWALGQRGTAGALFAGLFTAAGLKVALGAAGFYARQAFLPFTYQPYVEYAPEDALHRILGALAVAATIVLGVRAMRGRRSEILLGLAWAWLALAPSIATAHHPPSTNAVADRHLYAALPGLALVIAALLRDFAPRRRLFWSSCGVSIAILFGAFSVSRDRVWHDGLTLWAHSVSLAPDSRYALANLGTELLLEGRSEEAEAAYRAAVASPQRGTFMKPEAAAELAILMVNQGRFQEADPILRGVEGIRVDSGGAYRVLLARGLIESAAGRKRAAIQAFERAERLAPSDPTVSFRLAQAFEADGLRVDAVAAYGRVILGSGAKSRPDLVTRAKTEAQRLLTSIRAETDPSRKAFESARIEALQNHAAQP